MRCAHPAFYVVLFSPDEDDVHKPLANHKCWHKKMSLIGVLDEGSSSGVDGSGARPRLSFPILLGLLAFFCSPHSNSSSLSLFCPPPKAPGDYEKDEGDDSASDDAPDEE